MFSLCLIANLAKLYISLIVAESFWLVFQDFLDVRLMELWQEL